MNSLVKWRPRYVVAHFTCRHPISPTMSIASQKWVHSLSNSKTTILSVTGKERREVVLVSEDKSVGALQYVL